MKVLILSCNTGQGHNQAGRAIHEKLLERGVECEFVDTLSLVGQKTSDVVSNTYVSMTTHTPQLFHLLYKAGGAISNTRVKSPVYWANKLYREKLLTYLLENRVDAVVTPHLFPAETLTSLRRKGQLTVKTVAVATDYTCIPFWEETDMDYYVVPHRDLVDEFAGKGIPREKLLPFGIPVKNKRRSPPCIGFA